MEAVQPSSMVAQESAAPFSRVATLLKLFSLITLVALHAGAAEENNWGNENWSDETNASANANLNANQNSSNTSDEESWNNANANVANNDETTDESNQASMNASNSQNANFLTEGSTAGKASEASDERQLVKSYGLDHFFVDNRGLPHPSTATSMATRRMLSVQKLPEAAQLDACIREFQAIANESLNSEVLQRAVSLMTSVVARNTNFYHWCFYNFVSSLDWKLEDGSQKMTLSDKMTLFTDNMKALWILARAQDRAVKSRIYYDYLQARYIEIANSNFGRQLDILSAPLGDKGWRPIIRQFKPAGPFVESP